MATQTETIEIFKGNYYGYLKAFHVQRKEILNPSCATPKPETLIRYLKKYYPNANFIVCSN